MTAIEWRLSRFAVLTPAQRQALRQLGGQIIHAEPHQPLLRAGDAAAYTILLHEGWAMLFRDLPDSRRQIMNFCLPGDLVDPCSLLLTYRDFAVHAVTEVAFSRVSVSDLTELIAAHPELALPILWSEARDIHWLRSHLMSIGRLSARERLAALFVEFAACLEPVSATGVDKGFEIPPNQQMLADATGLSFVHVSRTLVQMRDEGLLERRGRRLFMVDIDGLRRIAPDGQANSLLVQ